MAVTTEMIKTLRARTGAGVMDCRRALEEAGGNIDRAAEVLRAKGMAEAVKRAGRTASEGVIEAYVHTGGRLGALVELNCETDFVAKNDDFIAFAKALAEIAATRDPGATEEDRRQKLVQKIGENITIRRCKRLQARGKLALYVHAGAKIGVLVDYEGPDETGKDVAMHIAFARPRHLGKSEVPWDTVAQERKIQQARARESGKPAEIAAKMVEGAVNKFLGEITLLGQPFIKDDKQTVEKMLAANKARVNGFAFLVVGEGIDQAGTSVH